LDEGENVSVGHGVSLLRWRSGGSNTPTIRRLIPSCRHQLSRIALHSLFVFEAAARNLNFKRAAGELNVTQPSVSHAIKALEKHCKVELFVRDNRGVSLTEAGRQLYDDVR
jgi:DNA-binding MarR family transcriptional regulator